LYDTSITRENEKMVNGNFTSADVAGKDHKMDLARCGSHERISDTVKRVEEYLESERQSNQEFRLYMTKALSAIESKLQEITDIKSTQLTNIKRREQQTIDCEGHRGELWKEINQLKTKMSEGKGFALGVAAFGGMIGSAIMLILNWISK
jgi:hypothetical protein